MGVNLNNVSDIYYVILCTSVLLIGRAGVNRIVRDYLHLKIEQLYDFPFWEIKKRKIVYDSVSLCWYFIIVLYGLYIAWDSPQFPSCLAGVGSGSCDSIVQNWPFVPKFHHEKLYHFL